VASPAHRIAIVGLGLIGGSLGLAIRAAGLRGVEVVGYDQERSALAKAKRLGAIDREAHDLAQAVAGASLVVIATPILAIRQVLREAAPHLSEGAVVTDTGSTKAAVLAWARELLPKGVHFVGGHPLAGKETQGIDNAQADLFRQRAYCLCPDPEADERAVRTVLGLVQVVGATPLFIDPQEHDQYVAAVSHLPLVVATALFTLVRGSSGWAEMAPLAASGFRDTTRLASGDPEMSHDICLTNQEAILHWLDRLIGELYRYRRLIAEGGTELFETFARAQLERDAFLAKKVVGREPPQVELPDFKDALASLFIGRALSERIRRLSELTEEWGKEPRPGQGEDRAQRLARLMRQRLERDLKRELEKGGDRDQPRK
jgi:prephenate dehydrogenase